MKVLLQTKIQAFPLSSWAKWPYTKDKIDLMETVRFENDQAPSNGTFNGRMIYFKYVVFSGFKKSELNLFFHVLSQISLQGLRRTNSVISFRSISKQLSFDIITLLRTAKI